MAVVTKHNSNSVSSSDKAKPACSLTERGLSGVKEGSSRLDNWLSEPPSITDKIAFHLPGRRALPPHKPTNAGLGNLDITGAPNRGRTPDEPWDMGSISIHLQYCDY